MSEKNQITLSQLASFVNDALASADLSNRWVVAEIANININRSSGHCYLELVEKSPASGQTLATIKATIWASKFKLIYAYFLAETGAEMAVGMKIMFCCNINFHPVYSISINITDIDPTYTVGESQRQRNLIIETLKKDGVFDMNKELEIPLVVQRIAVVSSANAAGYEDFLHQLECTKFDFQTTLFPAIMQGKETQLSVCEALSRIANRELDFDVVVVIRGGGATTDLQWFDSYEICSYIAQMPLPVVTGIGHTKDLSVADMVANLSLKTPTAVADHIIERAESFYDFMTGSVSHVKTSATKILVDRINIINNLSLKIVDLAKDSLNKQSRLLNDRQQAIQTSANQAIFKAQQKVSLMSERLINYSQNAIQSQKIKVKHFSELISSHDPKNVLKRGFAIVKLNGKIVSSPDCIAVEDTIEVEIKNKKITSKVTKIS